LNADNDRSLSLYADEWKVKMTKSELIEKLSDEHDLLNKKDAESIINLIFLVSVMRLRVVTGSKFAVLDLFRCVSEKLVRPEIRRVENWLKSLRVKPRFSKRAKSCANG